MDKEYFQTRFLKRAAVAATSNDVDRIAPTDLGTLLLDAKLQSSADYVWSKVNNKDRSSISEMVRFVLFNTMNSCDLPEKLRKGMYRLSFASDFAFAQSTYNDLANKLSEDDQPHMNSAFASIEERASKYCQLLINQLSSLSFNEQE